MTPSSTVAATAKPAAPKPIKDGIPKDEAAAIKKKFEDVGAKVEIEIVAEPAVLDVMPAEAAAEPEPVPEPKVAAVVEPTPAPQPEIDVAALIADDPNQIVAPPEKPKRGWWRR